MDAPAPAPRNLDQQAAPPAADGGAAGRLWPRPVQYALTLLLALALLGLAGASVLHGSGDPAATTTPQRIDLNRASHSELLLLPGVGPQLAQRIDKHRREHGPFQAVSDLRKVSGIGPALFERISPKVTVGLPVAMDPAERAEESLVEPPAKATKRSKVESLEGPIDINQADIHELQRLPGIGPKLSQRIVDERGRRAFQSVQDLRRVSGIGAKTLAKIKPFVKV